MLHSGFFLSYLPNWWRTACSYSWLPTSPYKDILLLLFTISSAVFADSETPRLTWDHHMFAGGLTSTFWCYGCPSPPSQSSIERPCTSTLIVGYWTCTAPVVVLVPFIKYIYLYLLDTVPLLLKWRIFILEI